MMQRKLETLQARQEAAVLGDIRWAVKTLDDILAERATQALSLRKWTCAFRMSRRPSGLFLRGITHLSSCFEPNPRPFKGKRVKRARQRRLLSFVKRARKPFTICKFSWISSRLTCGWKKLACSGPW